jgi:MarR family 2-MHQ and catechol resistance regulon transcriptional repressor
MLFHLGPLQQKAIGQKLLVSKSNVVAVIDKLESQSLLERRRDTDDRRCVYVHLTDKGRDLIQELFPGHAAAIVEEMGCLTAAEQKELGRLCRKLGLKEEA